MFLLAKYNTQTTFVFSVVKRGVVDLAVSADWTPATGDTKVSKDGGNVANTSNNPAAVGGTGSALWSLTLTATELSAAEVVVQIVDSATKAIEDQVLRIYTYGNASAKIPFDLSVATQPVNVTQYGGSAGTFASGRPEVNASHVAGAAVSTASAQIGVNVVNAGGTAWATAINAALDTHDGPDLPTGSVATDGGNSATSFKTDRTESVNDYWKDALLVLTSGTLNGQVKKVTAYNGTTKIITVAGGFTSTPADGVTFLLINR